MTPEPSFRVVTRPELDPEKVFVLSEGEHASLVGNGPMWEAERRF